MAHVTIQYSMSSHILTYGILRLGGHGQESTPSDRKFLSFISIEKDIMYPLRLFSVPGISIRTIVTA